jgi:hypothetical protein
MNAVAELVTAFLPDGAAASHAGKKAAGFLKSLRQAACLNAC